MADNTLNNDTTVDHTNPMTDDTEPATKHDVGIGGGIGAVGGAIVGALAGGPVGAIIGAVAGGAVSAGAVDVVDKHDHDYDRTAHGADDAVTTTGYGTTTPGYAMTGTSDQPYGDTAPGYAATAASTTQPYGNTTTGYADAATTGTPVSGYAADTDVDDVTRTGYATRPATTDTETLQLREEELAARKQTVQAGEVTLHKDVITETQTIDVPVTREELVIERHPVAGTQAATGTIGDGTDVIRVPLSEEQVTLEKNTVVTGEVSVGKRTVTDTEHLTGEVRREEARIENTDGATIVERGGTTNSGTF